MRWLGLFGLLCLLCFGVYTPAEAQESASKGLVAASATVTNTAATNTGAASTDPAAETRRIVDRTTSDERAKSDAYFEGKYWMLLWELLYGLVVAWLLLSRRVSAWMRDRAERITTRMFLQTAIYVAMYAPLVAVLTLPWTFYEGFVREHQYGLSNLDAAGWFAEWGMTLVVDTLMFIVAMVGLYAILRRAPRTWWVWGTVGGSMMLALMLAITPVFIKPIFNKYQPLPAGELRTEILAMARANGIPADDVYWFDASKQTKRISANVSGLFGTTRISLNDNLLNRTSPAEIRAVMAHEMGHYVLNHMPKHIVAFTLILLIGLLFVKFGWAWVYARFGARFGVRGIDDPAGLPLLLALLSVYFLLATPVTNTVIRTAEVEADLFGLNAAREPDGFAEAISKLGEYRKMDPGPVEEFFFFDHPGGYNRIFAAMRWKAAQTAVK